MTMLPDHAHVLRLLGACIQPPLMALVTPYCPKCGPSRHLACCLLLPELPRGPTPRQHRLLSAPAKCQNRLLDAARWSPCRTGVLWRLCSAGLASAGEFLEVLRGM